MFYTYLITKRALTVALACVVVACSTVAAGPSACEDAQVYALYSDFRSFARVGSISKAGVATDVTGADLDTDVTLAVHDGRAFLLARNFDALLELSAGCGLPQRRISLRNTAASAPLNPQDAVQSQDGSLWVANYQTTPLMRISADGTRSAVSIDNLDDDGEPQATFVHRYQSPAREEIVTWFARLDNNDPNLAPKGPATIVYVDAKTRLETRRVTTQGWNLFGMLDVHGAFAYAAAPGSFADAMETNAGIERLAIDAGSSALLLHERELGGSPTAVRISGDCAAVVVVDASEAKHSSLRSFDVRAPSTSLRIALGNTEGYDLLGLAWSNDVLFVGDRQNKQGRVRRFTKSADCTLTESLTVIVTQGLPFVLAAVAPQP